MANGLATMTMKETNYMSYWAIVNVEINAGLDEIVLVGNGIHETRKVLQASYFPLQVVMGTTTTSALPLVKDKQAIGGRDTIYVCYNRTCQLPVHELNDAVPQFRHR
jgi:uncharacterized protein YyaL (SSP411 family)